MYTALVLEQFQNPHNLRALEGADAIGQAGAPGEGPYLKVYLRLQAARIMEAAFETYGCPSAIACGSWLTRWVEGKTPEQARILTAEDLMKVLGGLPLGKEHAAHLAVNALRKALEQLPTAEGAAEC